MSKLRQTLCLASLPLLFIVFSFVTQGQSSTDEQFGPVVRAYLGYLRNEQHVVDDRVSRREIKPEYYRRNSNRIRALRSMAIRIADETGNDYLPELEAVAADEFRQLFENPPTTRQLRVGEVFRTTFRFLGTVKSGEQFYLFARLDPYEQAELMEKSHNESQTAGNPGGASTILPSKDVTRARRVTNP